MSIIKRMEACAQAMKPPDINPLADDECEFIVTPHLRYIDGVLSQLWIPTNWEKRAPEWRAIPEDPVPSVVTNLSGADGGGSNG